MKDWKRRFVIIWTGQLFSVLSSYAAQFAIILWISLETGSAGVLSIATIAGILPQIVLGPLAGVYVDRWSRKWTMIGADGFVALCSAVMAVLFYFDAVPLWGVYLVLMLRSIGSAFHAPAMKSSVPLLAPQSELNRIAGVNQTIQSVSSIGGPVIGAILITSLNMTAVMLLDVVGAAIACVALLFVDIPNPLASKKKNHILRDMKDGFIAILSNRGLSWVMLMEVVGTFFIMPIISLLPLMTIEYFKGGAFEVSMVEMSFGLGALLGGVLLGVWNPKVRKVSMISCSYFLYGIAFTINGMLPSSAFYVYVACNFIQGIILPFYAGPFTALLQTQVDPAYQGRVFALFDSLSLMPSVFGLLALGVLADLIGITTIFIIGGIAVVIASVVLISIPSVRSMEAAPDKEGLIPADCE